MKKISVVLMAVALVLGMTQCKKKAETLTQQQGKFITLTVDNNSKVVVNENGVVTFETGDFILVLSNSNPVGALIYQNGAFSGILGAGSVIGNLPDPVEGLPLQFLFTGNHFPDDDWTINISDQYDDLAVLSTGASNELYDSEVTNYSSTLENKCALVKFTLAQSSTDMVRVKMVNKAQLTIDSETGEIGIEPTSSVGYVTLKNLGNNKERWAVVLPQSAASTDKTIDGNKVFYNKATVPAVEINDLNLTGTISNDGTPDAYIEVPYFMIDDDQTYVQIASGNVQYNASSNTWRFAENQWDYVGGTDGTNTWGNVSGSTNNSIGVSGYNGWIDLFGWGTGGADATETSPIETRANHNYYAHFYDWGDRFTTGDWRTLDSDEWLFLFDRPNKSCPATINKDGSDPVKGFILLPDFFVYPAGCDEIYHPVQNDPDNPWDDYTRTEYTSAQWSAMETAGAIFLPCAGYRYPGTNDVVYSGGEGGTYWTNEKVNKDDPHIRPEDKDPATAPEDHYSANWAYYLHISNVYFPYGGPRYFGRPVRLVEEVEFDINNY